MQHTVLEEVMGWRETEKDGSLTAVNRTKKLKKLFDPMQVYQCES